MPFGAVFINSDNRVQIDETMPCLSLISRGTDTATQQVMGSSTSRIKTLSFSGASSPILAIGTDKPSNGERGFQVVDIINQSGTWTFTVLIWTQYGSSEGWPFRWYLYDSPKNTQASNYGMVVKNSLGEIVFNSNNSPARVVSAASSGGTFAGINTGALEYTENWSWDTIQQQDILNWTLSCSPMRTYAGSGTVSGFIDGQETFQSPTIPYPHTINYSPVVSKIFMNVTNT